MTMTLLKIFLDKTLKTASVVVEATKNWVGKTSSTKLYLKDIINLTTSFS